MPRKAKGPTLEQILEIEICECATVRDVIDDAVRQALDWYEKGECKVRQTASLFLALRVLQQLLIQMAGSESVAREAAKFIQDSRDLASDIEEDCQPYILKSFAYMASARRVAQSNVTLQ